MSFVIDMYDYIILSRLYKSIKEYQYTLNMKFAEKGKDIFPFDAILTVDFSGLFYFFRELFSYYYNFIQNKANFF